MRRLACLVTVVTATLLPVGSASSQQLSDESVPPPPSSFTRPNVHAYQMPEDAEKRTSSVRNGSGGLTTTEIALSIGVLGFTVAVLIVVAWLRTKGSISGDATFKLLGLMIVVGSALFLMTAGWSQQQITPIVGLLGTGLGFIFGKDMSADEGKAKPPSVAG